MSFGGYLDVFNSKGNLKIVTLQGGRLKLTQRINVNLVKLKYFYKLWTVAIF